MSQENVEVVRRLHELEPDDVLSGRDLGDLFDPDVDWLPASESVLAVDGYHGHEGVRRFWRELLSTWDEYLVEPEEFLDLGSQVVVVMRIRAQSPRGIQVKETWSALYTVRDERIVRFEGFRDQNGALEAVGLRE